LDQYENLDRSKKLLQKQTTQLKTAYDISTSIRQSLNINDTLKAITDTLVNEAGFEAAFIELCRDADEKEINIKAQSGLVKEFTHPIHIEIVINENLIGDLIVYPKPEIDFRESDELLEYLTPVINITIHDALVLRTVTDYRDNLEQKVLDRTSELRRARDELTEINKLLKDAQQAQNRFFTNISHEFRTPLTLILGPSKQIFEQSKEEKTKTTAELIHRSANKLNRLKLKAWPLNLVNVVRGIANSFYSLAERKKITLEFNCDEREIVTYVDRNKIDKILNNILSNAFKFTPENGKVEI
jgi:signal transduction histidine kinase